MKKIETFKCATGAGWGILYDGLMDCDVPYAPTEAKAVDNAVTEGYPRRLIVTTASPEHYSSAYAD